MKRLILLSALLIFACTDDEGNPCVYEPTLSTEAVTDITETSATLNGIIAIVSENCDVPNNAEQGFVYSTEIQPTLADIQVNVNGANITTTVEGLTPNTNYYVRSFMTNNFGDFYGNEVDFTTVAGQIVLNTFDVTDVTENSVVSGAEIVSDGNTTITSRGVCWSISPNPTISDVVVIDNGSNNTFTSLIEGLSPNTQYYVRSYATNEFDTFYGNEIEFNTICEFDYDEDGICDVAGQVVLTTNEITNISENSALSGAQILTDGNTTITSRGVCWSISPNPTISDVVVIDNGSNNTFTSLIEGLSPNTQYYVRSYATNEFDTFYGNEIEFNTICEFDYDEDGICDSDDEDDVLVWSDEFDGNGVININHWNYETGGGGWGNQEVQTNTNSLNNLYKENGILNIKAIKESNGTYTSARITTQDKFEFKYGRVKIRAKLPTTQGTVPKLWMLGANIFQVGWPECGEIGVMEQKVNKEIIKSKLVWKLSDGNTATYENEATNLTSNEFHIYSIYWTSTSVKAYIDGEEYLSINISDLYAFGEDFFLIFNLAMGGTNGGAIDLDFTQDTMEVDYVRVYQ